MKWIALVFRVRRTTIRAKQEYSLTGQSNSSSSVKAASSSLDASSSPVKETLGAKMPEPLDDDALHPASSPNLNPGEKEGELLHPFQVQEEGEIPEDYESSATRDLESLCPDDEDEFKDDNLEMEDLAVDGVSE